MTPQEWIDKVEEPECAAAFYATQKVHKQAFVTEGAQHLAAALDAVATMSPSCERCQSAHRCSVRDDSAKIPLYVSDPEGPLPLWMPWTNADVQARLDSVYAQVDALREDITRLKARLSQAEVAR